jgi:hypothetical protein
MEHTMNLNVGFFVTGAPLMPEVVADPSLLSCNHLFSGPGIKESQQLAPDLFRARRARAAVRINRKR